MSLNYLCKNICYKGLGKIKIVTPGVYSFTFLTYITLLLQPSEARESLSSPRTDSLMIWGSKTRFANSPYIRPPEVL